MNSDLVDQLGAYRSVLEDAMDEAESIDDVKLWNDGPSPGASHGLDEPIVISLTDSEPTRRSWKAIAGLVAAAAFLTVGVVLTTGDDKGVVDVSDGRRATEPAVAESPPPEASVTESTLDTLPGRSNADSVEQRRIEDAAFFRLGVINQSGQVHLSLSDYAQIRAEACAGAVNQPSELVELARRWGLAGLLFDEEQSANGLWMAARASCPEMFDDQDFTKGPPFALGSGGSQQTLTSPPPAGAQVAFVDVSVLEDPQWRWSGDQKILIGTTTLSPEQTIDHFLGAFSDAWTVNEVLGPVVDISGSGPLWSMDIFGEGFTGVVDVTDGGAETFVLLAVVDSVYPLAVVAANPALDGDLDCLTGIQWNAIFTIAPDASGPDNPEAALDQYLEPLRLRHDLDLVSHVRPGVGSLSVDGREVIVAYTVSVPAAGYFVERVKGCEPYSPG